MRRSSIAEYFGDIPKTVLGILFRMVNRGDCDLIWRFRIERNVIRFFEESLSIDVYLIAKVLLGGFWSIFVWFL